MRRLVKIFLPLLILAAGAASFALLRSLGDPPQRLDRPYRGPLVQAIEAPEREVRVVVDAQGTVRPDAQIDLVPQVSGAVVWKASSLEPGGVFAQGELLLRIDPRDYELAARQAEAAVEQTRYRLELAREEAEVARREWEQVSRPGEEPTQLVLRIPQLRAAEAEWSAARARLDEAHLRLERTRLQAPFAGRVRSVRADVGQHLNAGQPVAQIYSIEKAEIVVPVPDEDLAFFALPAPLPGRFNGHDPSPASVEDALRREGPGPLFAARGADALVSGLFAGRRHQWRGRVVRSEGEIDPQSRMARLVVEVDQPYAGVVRGEAPLTVGMFVEVAIAGRALSGVRALPRAALRQGDRVWVVDREGILHMRPARVVRSMKEEVLVEVGMGEGEKIVVSQLSGATDGMKVRLAATSEEVLP